VVLLLLTGVQLVGQNFNTSKLKGITLTSPTTLHFGPDGRLYVAQQDGTIFAYTIQKNAANDYQVISTETILLVKQITNHDDDGSENLAETDRQVTGILTAGTPSNPVLYVSSSDPRIGGGEGGGIGDVGLDTNSGVISKLTWNGSSWDKIDLVKGLPRSEENHAVNGMQLDETNNILYLAMGGNTNAGSPSVNFTYITEYALAAAVLSIDLSMIENDFGGSYDLPTLDDPTRPNTGPGGSDLGDPFGGNDGLNQAKIVEGGPVQVYSPGFRNIYDLVLTKTAGVENRLYTIDNGPNGGWGGYPENEGTANVTNNYVPGEPGSQGPGMNDDVVNNLDNLHLVSAPGFGPIYGGHPNPIRANPAGAGLYRRDDTNQEFFELSPTVDWPPVPVSMANPIEGDYQNPGVDDGALATFVASTNGMTEYTATNFFGGTMTGDLLAASFDDNIYRIQLSANGQAATSVSVFASGFGSIPLDVTAQGTGEIFEGTVWAVTYVGEEVVIFEPDALADDGWAIETSTNDPTERHENAYVEADGLFYLIGGRGNKPLDIYDPVSQTWSTGTPPPLEMHHFQAISYQGDIYVIGGFTGDFPDETPLANVYIYSPATDTWSTGPVIPMSRRRGSAGVVVYNDHIYVVCGIQNGHIDGWVPWFDEFDPATGTWTVLPDAPRARDHFQAAMSGDKLFAVGGRRTGENSLFTPTVPEVDVYDFNTGTWSTLTANIPTQRAGATTVEINGTVIVIGGETEGQTVAHNETEALDPVSNIWTTLDPLNTGRHGTQAVTYMGKIYIAAGSGNQGGGPELTSQEFLNLAGNCTGDPNDFSLDDDNDGYSNGDETLNGTDPCSAASRPPDNDGDLLSDLLDDDDDNDGLSDTVDLFALDDQNGETTSLPIDYPFLNGNPGFGLFGLGYTGLMTNQTDDYLDLFDGNNPGLIMGGASGIATIPASSGDALTNDQEYAFHFGVSVNSSTSVFTVRSALEGTPFFNGFFQDQSQGIFIGNGDQDNYLKFVLAANNGNGGFQLLAENNGVQVLDAFFPVADILTESEIILEFEIDPAAGTAQPRYSIDNSTTFNDLGTPISLTGNLLSTVQGPNSMAVGLIATSGSAPSFQASYDFMEINLLPVFQTVYRINSGGPAYTFESENWQADQYNDAEEVYPVDPNPLPIANTTNDQLYQTEVNSSMDGFTYQLPVENGDYDINLHFAEIYYGVEAPGGVGSRLFNVDIENGQETLNTYDIIQESGGAATAVTESFNGINVSDGNLTITFSNIVDRAKVSGIEVLGVTSSLAPTVLNPGNQLVNPGEFVQFQVFAEDPNPDDVLTYSAEGLPASLAINSTTGVISGTLTDPIGDYQVTVQAADDGGLFSKTTFNIYVDEFQSLYKINSGGPAFSFDGVSWAADQYNDGLSYENVVPIENTLNDQLYQTEAYGELSNFSYSIPVPQAGIYAVKLHFAEIFHGVENTSGEGARIFNMEIEGGQAQLTNYDVFQQAGGAATAITTSFSGIQVDDGMLDIEFLASVDNPKVSGIEVFNTVSPQSPPVLAQPLDQIFNEGEQVFIQVNANDPNFGDNLTYTATGLPASLSIDGATGLISGTLSDPSAEYPVTVRATDDDGLFDEKTFTITIGSFTSLTRINAGGPAYSYNGENWLADQYGNATGQYPMIPNPLPISATENDQLYQTESFDENGSFTYNIPVPASGEYAARIHFAEIFYGVENSAAEGARIFNVNVEGGQGTIDNLDLIAQAGSPQTAIIAGFGGINVTDGFFTVEFTGVVDNPKLSGIELFTVDQSPFAPLVVDPQNQVLISGETANIQINAFDVNAGDVITYGAVGLPNGVTIDPTSGLISGVVNDAAGDYQVTVTAQDQGGLSDDALFTITVGDFIALYRINSGGPAYTFNGQDWQADQYSDANGQYPLIPNPIPIAATSNDELYQTETFDDGGSFSYNIPVPSAGNYLLRLHFAEIFHGIENSNGTGARILNIDVEGGQATIADFDIVNQVGASATAYIIGFKDVNVTDGFLTVAITGVVDNPKISGIEVLSDPVAAAPPTVVNPGNQFFNNGEMVGIQVNADDPNFDDVLTYSASGLPAGVSIDPVSGLISGTVNDLVADYSVTITVTDDDGLSVNDAFVISIGNYVPVVRINSGGPSFTFNSQDWQADQYNDGTGNYSTTESIEATANDLLYQTELFDESGTFNYDIPVPAAGEYAVRLHFTEIFYGVDSVAGVGARVFNVDLESGQGQITNLDLLASVGEPLTAFIASFQGINVSDGLLTIAFEGVTDNPKISGIEVFSPSLSPPVLDPIGAQTLAEGEMLDVTVTASDDSGPPSITSDVLPPFISLLDNGDGSALLTITPGPNHAGVYNITIIATDIDGQSDTEALTVTVMDTNFPPVLATIGDQEISEGSVVEVPISANDPDNEIPAISANGLPTFAELIDNNNGTATLTLSPGFMDAGIYNITVTATDALGLQDEEMIQITVVDVNAPPVLADIADQQLEEGSSLTVDLSATDPDGDLPAISASGLEDFMTFTDNGNGTGELLLDPDYNQFGVFDITISATDPSGAVDQQQVQVTVSEITADPDWMLEGVVINANCLNQEGRIILEVSGGFGDLSFEWSNGATTRDLLDIPAGSYSVVVTDQKLNQTSESFLVNTQPGPQKPILSMDGDLLESTSAESYQWSFNGDEIEGATSRSIEVTLAGEYSVAITDGLGCTVMSDPFEVSFDSSELNVFPVPTDGKLNVEVVLMEAEVISIILLDQIGRQTPMGVYDLAAGRHKLKLNFNDSFANGVYMLMHNGKNFQSNLTRILLVR